MPLGDEAEIGPGRFPAVAISDTADYTLAYESYDPDGGGATQVYVEHYDAFGNQSGERVTLSSSTGMHLNAPSVAMRGGHSATFFTGEAPDGADEDDSVRRLLTRQADSFIEEIRGSVNYHLSQSGDSTLGRLVVAGNGARLPHLANRVARALGTRVEPARVLDHVSVGRVQMTEPQLLELQPVLPAPVGLALWGSYIVPPTNRFAHVGS